MNTLIKYQWEIFIGLEILSVICLLIFGFVRYMLGKKSLSHLFIGGFLLFLVCEALLSLMIYRETGEFGTFQIVIIIFVIYACTFGISDFKRLDRWMRKKVGEWKKEELLTEKDYALMEMQANPKYIAKKNRRSAMIHLVLFIAVQSVFWYMGTNSFEEMLRFLSDWSWIESGDYLLSPYPNETLYAIGIIWGIVFIVDFIWSLSYTIFPPKEK